MIAVRLSRQCSHASAPAYRHGAKKQRGKDRPQVKARIDACLCCRKEKCTGSNQCKRWKGAARDIS